MLFEDFFFYLNFDFVLLFKRDELRLRESELDTDAVYLYELLFGIILQHPFTFSLLLVYIKDLPGHLIMVQVLVVDDIKGRFAHVENYVDQAGSLVWAGPKQCTEWNVYKITESQRKDP